jgi:hypothetical protein
MVIHHRTPVASGRQENSTTNQATCTKRDKAELRQAERSRTAAATQDPTSVRKVGYIRQWVGHLPTVGAVVWLGLPEIVTKAPGIIVIQALANSIGTAQGIPAEQTNVDSITPLAYQISLVSRQTARHNSR